MMEARNFLMVKMGDKDWQVLAQADWLYTNVATGDKDKVRPDFFPTKITYTALASKSDPLFEENKTRKTTD